MPGVSVGLAVVIGAGAVVTRNVSPFQIVIGNLSRVAFLLRLKVILFRPYIEL